MVKTNKRFTPLQIEKLEKDVLLKFGWLFKNSLDEFSTSIDRSLGYLDKIILPIIIASKQDKSYNPFSEIIEKYTLHILTHKLEKEGYRLLPLGYAADLSMETNNHILSIDIKTANLDNPSDFKETIPVGINQITHVAKLPLGRVHLPYPYLVYPTIPPFYELPSGETKLILTYGLMFIYPSYKDLIEEIRNNYTHLFTFFKTEVEAHLIPVLKKIKKIKIKSAKKILESKPQNGKYTRKELIAESLIRGIFIHKEEKEEIVKALRIDSSKFKSITKFNRLLDEFTKKLRKRNVKPIAIVAISIPNGLLKEFYMDEFVSGKNYGKSARYHYADGIFKVLDKTGERVPRVLFLALDENFKKELKQYFKKIHMLDYQIKTL